MLHLQPSRTNYYMQTGLPYYVLPIPVISMVSTVLSIIEDGRPLSSGPQTVGYREFICRRHALADKVPFHTRPIMTVDLEKGGPYAVKTSVVLHIETLSGADHWYTTFSMQLHRSIPGQHQTTGGKTAVRHHRPGNIVGSACISEVATHPMVSRLRSIFQILFFVLLTYGGRIGIHLSYALPCFACPYVTGCGGGCYLMALQGSWWGMQMATASLMSHMGINALLYLGLFLLLSMVLGKFWCGWICPFGTLQDWITQLRKRLGIAEARMRWLTRDRLKWIKYILLAYLIVIPLLIAHAGLQYDFGLPFCQICPAKPLMPLFAGITRHLALDATNAITLTFSILSLVIAGSMLVGMFFKERFFLLVLSHAGVDPHGSENQPGAAGQGCGRLHRMRQLPTPVSHGYPPCS